MAAKSPHWITWSCTQLNKLCRFQSLLAVLHALLHFCHGIRACGNLILELDRGRELVLVLLEGLKNIDNRSRPLAPRQVGSARLWRGRSSVLEVQAGDPFVILDDRGNRALAGAGIVVAAVEIDGVALRLVEHGVPRSFGGLLVSVIGGDHAVLQRRVAHTFGELAGCFRQFEAELGGSKSRTHFKEVVELFIVHLLRRCELMTINLDARIVIELAEFFELVHRRRKAPGLQLLRRFLLLGSHRPAAATTTAASAASTTAPGATTATGRAGSDSVTEVKKCMEYCK